YRGNGVNHLLIAGTAAQGPAQPFPDVLLGKRCATVLVYERLCRQHHAWNAEAALHCAVFEEGFLHGIERSVCRETFYGRDRATLALRGEPDTGGDRGAVDQNRADAAFSLQAVLLCADQAEFAAQDSQQGPLRLDRELDRPTIYREFQIDRLHDLAPRATSRLRWS